MPGIGGIETLVVKGYISNIGDKKYYNRVFGNGIEPGLRRTYYGGFSYEF